MAISRSARQATIIEILRGTRVTSQVQLAEILYERGIEITQATLSRDLSELGARKVHPKKGDAYYAIKGVKDLYGEDVSAAYEKMRRMIDELVVSYDYSGSVVVLRMPPGGGQYLASFIDRVNMDDVVGCIAGDDTVFVLAREPVTGKELIKKFIGD